MVGTGFGGLFLFKLVEGLGVGCVLVVVFFMVLSGIYVVWGIVVMLFLVFIFIGALCCKIVLGGFLGVRCCVVG